MSFTSLNLCPSYSSDYDDILNNFYIPVLGQSSSYDRLAGFFSSTCLAVVARGILGLISNGGHMRLITSVKLPEDDVNMLEAIINGDDSILTTLLDTDLDLMPNKFVSDHVKALGWLFAQNKLEIKVAIPNSVGPRKIREPIFHQKVAILRDDEENIISYSGSINETAAAWLGNIEEFKVFKSWDPGDKKFVEADENLFKRLWNNESPKTTVINLPQAIKDKMIKTAPKDIEELNLMEWYRKMQNRKVKLYQHQIDARSQWIGNGLKGIFEMATGSGKTITAAACIEYFCDIESKGIIIVACPQSHLFPQWQDDIDTYGLSFDFVLVADGNNPEWRKELANSLIDLDLGYKKYVLLMTTHRTLSSPKFKEIIEDCGSNIPSFLVADEVHGLGSRENQKGLLDIYIYRLGLSATVERQYDESGTKFLLDYFQGICFEFGLNKGINTTNPETGLSYLTSFSYNPFFVSLTLEELEKYLKITKSLIKLSFQVRKGTLDSSSMESLFFKRANIVKNAECKYEALEEILEQLGAADIRWLIIYCGPEQIDKVMQILSKHGIKKHMFTMAEGTHPRKEYGGVSEREYILKSFSDGYYQVLVAMKCLDEGVNVPPARSLILMSSSGNRREYVQRIGRIIRRYPDKMQANVYDIVASPPVNSVPEGFRDIEKSILEKEMLRYREIASYSNNTVDAINKLYEIQTRLLGG